jgi:hypothetical protein
MSIRVYINYITNCTQFWSKVDNNLHVHGRIKLGNGEKDDVSPITYKIKKIWILNLIMFSSTKKIVYMENQKKFCE